MEKPEYDFSKECPKCGNSSSVSKEFHPRSEEYLSCVCNVCSFRYTMQTKEDMFKQMEISWEIKKAKWDKMNEKMEVGNSGHKNRR